MKRWGLRASSLTTDTKADAGQDTSSNHLNPNVFILDVIGCRFIHLPLNF